MDAYASRINTDSTVIGYFVYKLWALDSIYHIKSAVLYPNI